MTSFSAYVCRSVWSTIITKCRQVCLKYPTHRHLHPLPSKKTAGRCPRRHMASTTGMLVPSLSWAHLLGASRSTELPNNLAQKPHADIQNHYSNLHVYCADAARPEARTIQWYVLTRQVAAKGRGSAMIMCAGVFSISLTS